MTNKAQIDIRKEMGHPILDMDGHVVEMREAVLPYIREAMNAKAFERFLKVDEIGMASYLSGGKDQGRRRRRPQGAWWATPASTEDFATVAIPRVLYERLDELQMDFCVLYMTRFIGAAASDDEEVRRGVCHGLNDYYAATYGPFADRLAISALIPMHSPAEAIAELEHCAKIGLKMAAIPEGVWRQIPDQTSLATSPPPHGLAPGQTHWFDNFGLDSEFDYDPVWAKFIELRFPLVSHGGIGQPPPIPYTSITNYSANHIGNFRDKMYQLCRSLYMSGVTRRFPTLKIGFQECGVGWATTLLSDTLEHWEKRNKDAIKVLDPKNIDFGKLEEIFRSKGSEILNKIRDGDIPKFLRSMPLVGSPPENRDDWRHLDVTDENGLVDLFAPRMFFGCEADDKTVAFAYSPANPRGSHMRAMFGSDIGHWDVPDLSKVVPDSYKLVTKKLLTPDQYREFVFGNGLELLLSANPDFFKGTALESAAKKWSKP